MSDARRRALARERVRRFRARRAGLPEPAPFRPGACERCGAQISRYAPDGATLCSPCGGNRYETHLELIDAVAAAAGEPPAVCSRGHDLDLYGREAIRENGRTTRICSECKRERDREYARRRRTSCL